MTNNGALIFNRSDMITFDGAISGTGALTQSGGTTILTANNSYAGATHVNGGVLFVDGDQTAAAGPTTVASGAGLGGAGIVGGDVTIEDGGTLRPGSRPFTAATLTINGDLNLGSGSTLLYNLVQANTAGGALNDLTVVHGDLTLDGQINIVDQGQSFGPGVYRVINYDGALTNNGLNTGILTPDGVTGGLLTGFSVQTAISGQVNLINTTGVMLNYWDGDAGPKNNSIINGGDGVWRVAQPASTSNWTGPDGVINAPWADGQFAIFAGAPGTVQVDDTVHGDGSGGAVNVSGMQFASSGYTIQGDALNLVDNASNPGVSIIRVGDGTAGAASATATITSALSGATMLEKTDLGTLTLGGANTYTGGTQIVGGAIAISSDANLGAVGTGLTLDGGTLITTANITTPRAVTLGANGGAFAPASATALTLSGAVSGAGVLTKADAGTLIITSAAAPASTIVSGGTLQIGAGGASGSISGDVVDNATLNFNRSDTITYGGAVTGSGALVQAGAGTLVLTGDSFFSGATTIAAGTLQLGDGGTTGSVTSDIVDNGTLVVNRSDNVVLNGLISGSGDFVQAGTGTTIMAATGDGHGHGNSYSGRTIIEQGSLQIGTGGTTGGLENSVDIVNDGVFISSIHASFAWAGSVSGTGSVIIDQGAGNTLTVLGAHTYTGGTTIASGIVQIGDGGTAGTMLGDIANFGTLVVDHSDDLILANLMTGTGNAIKKGANTIVSSATAPIPAARPLRTARSFWAMAARAAAFSATSLTTPR